MTREKVKVLEMVAEGKITAEEGVRLIEAMGKADRGTRRGRGPHIEIPDVHIPKIDLGNMGEMVVELRKGVEQGARRATSRLRGVNAGKHFRYQDYPVNVGWPDGVERCNLKLESSAGKLKLKGADITGKVLYGKVKRTSEEPRLEATVDGDACVVNFRQVVGRGLLRFNQHMPCTIALNNSAADARLNLEKVRVEHLEISNNAGNAIIRLGTHVARVSVAADNNAGNLRLVVPESYALRIKHDKNMSADNLGGFDLQKEDGALVSSDWEDNDHQASVVLDQNVANFRLVWRKPKKAAAPEEDMDADVDLDDLDEFGEEDDEDDE